MGGILACPRLGRPVDILMITIKRKRRCRYLRQRPGMDRTSEADPAVIDFAGLEPQLSDKVDLACVATLRGDLTKRSRIKILIRENEIRMVQNVDGRGLDLEPD